MRSKRISRCRSQSQSHSTSSWENPLKKLTAISVSFQMCILHGGKKSEWKPWLHSQNTFVVDVAIMFRFQDLPLLFFPPTFSANKFFFFFLMKIGQRYFLIFPILKKKKNSFSCLNSSFGSVRLLWRRCNSYRISRCTTTWSNIRHLYLVTRWSNCTFGLSLLYIVIRSYTQCHF